ncbi:MAG TPA: translocation/assembly module TamB domain-containing protein [Steroidobacteraceae bacterium]|nr:translocation/assembly module TamB domain-containing protein [Steroidobacteraceae bacterium]
MRRLLLITAGLLIFLAIAVPSAAVYYVVFTESGFKFIVSRIPHKIGTTTLEIVNPTGTVAAGIHVDAVDVNHHLAHVRVENIQGNVRLLPLLWQNIRSPNAYIGRVTVEVKRRTRPPGPGEPLFVPRWMVISAEHAHIGIATVSVYNGFRMQATDIDGSALIRHRTIRLFEAQGQIADTHVSGIGLLRAADPFGIDVDTRLNWSPDGQPAWAATVAAKGDLASLGLTIHTTAPFRCDFTGQALDLTSHWHWLGKANVHDLDIRVWGASGALGLITGQAALHGNKDGFGGSGIATPTGLKVGDFQTEFDGFYSNHVLTARHMSARHVATGATATGSGTFEVVKGGPRLDLQGDWKDFRWPLVGKDKDVPFHSPSGTYTLKGVLPYDVHLDGIAKVLDLPLMPTQVDGELGKDHFTYRRGEVDLFAGHASVSGTVTWAPRNSWAVAGRLTGIDPSYFRPDLPGKLNFDLAVAEQSFDPNGDISIDISDLGGRLRGALASGGGKLSHGGKAWTFDSVRVGLGRTNIGLDGRISSQFDLRFSVAAEDLSLLAPESRGQLKAAGTVRGTLDDPVVVASAHGNGIQHNGVKLEHLDADIDFDPHDEHESRVDARLRNLTYENRTFEHVGFTLAGKPSSFVLHLDVEALGLDASAQAVGPYSQGVFNGQLTRLSLTSSESLRLELERPVGLMLSHTLARIEWLCLTGKPASVCADGNWSPERWSTTLTASHLPISTLTAGMTPAVEYQGTININARAFEEGADAVQGNARLELTDAQLAHKLLNHRVEHTRIGSGTVTLNANRTVIMADAKLEDGEVGTINANFEAQRGAAQWQSMPVRGELHAHTNELNLVELYIPEIDRAAGELAADVQIAGTLGTPSLNGAVKVSKGEVDFYQVNLGLRDLGMEARLTDTGINFSGTARVGSGTTTAGGHLEWRDSLPYGKFTLQGSNLRVVDVPEAQIEASPDLEFRVDGRKIDVTGSVSVPLAKIEPKDLTGAVRASSDEVILGTAAEDPAKRFEVVTNITLTLGDHVSIQTSGLTGRLTGSITVRSGNDAVTRATGELSVEEGKYVAYAHNLDIQRGRLIFTGGPVDDPGIDIRAIRKFPDVTAGVNVRGTLLQPRLSFFSEPSLAQAEIVSLLLSGSLSTTPTRPSGAASNAALVQGGAMLAQELGQHVGIQQVGVESDLLTNDTSLVLGRYLSPRLYVSYGISLTEQLNTLKLRYSLGDHWVIRTEVGQARGADLVYSIDK